MSQDQCKVNFRIESRLLTRKFASGDRITKYYTFFEYGVFCEHIKYTYFSLSWQYFDSVNNQKNLKIQFKS